MTVCGTICVMGTRDEWANELNAISAGLTAMAEEIATLLNRVEDLWTAVDEAIDHAYDR